MLKEKVIEAYVFAKDKHKGQKRKFLNKEYFVHPKYVARVIEYLTKDERLIIVSLLHDVLEDTDATYEEVKIRFGIDIADWVEELTTREKGDKKKILTKKMKTMSSEAFTVKLADRFNNVLFLESDQVPVEFVKKYWKETRYIFKEISDKKLNKVQKVLIKRINVILDFLEIRHNFRKE